MFQEYRNRLLKGAGWLCLFGAIVTAPLAIWYEEFRSVTNWIWVGQTFVLGILLLVFSKRWPRNNAAGWGFVIFEGLMHLVMMLPEISTQGKIQTYHLFTYPILSYFFVGRKGGLIANTVILLGMFVVFAIEGWNFMIFGPKGQVFLVIWLIVAASAYLLEYVREEFELRVDLTTHTDNLTGLANRSGFINKLDIAVRRGRPFCLVMMDLDYFHRINLILGTQQSDTLLIKVAETLIRQDGFFDLSRHYGDEFVWIFEESPDHLERRIASLQESLNLLSHSMAIPVALTGSFGYSVFPEDSSSARVLWGQAELALKKAKMEGRKCLRRFRKQDADLEKHNGELVNLLEKAIERKDLQVHFQPKISLEEKRVCGMESLVRWTHDIRGFISPAEFVPLAEQSGMIHPMSELVTEKSIEFLGQLIQQGYPEMTVSINISPAQVLRGDLCQKLEDLCHRFDVPTKQIYLEITEGLLVQEGADLAMHSLREAGFKLALDDFGTGYSSLSYLHRFHFDELKVDKSFTDGIMRSERERRIFDTVLGLSRDLGYSTVVEGVEKKEQVRYIQNFGIPQIQGWFFASAMPAPKFLDYIKNFEFETALAK